MVIIEEMANFLSVSLAEFSIAEYILTKGIEIGTGKLWDEIKKRLPQKSLESQLYDAIEASVIEFSRLNDLNQIASACEIIYGRWIKNGYLSEDDVKEALAFLNSGYIATRNVEVWFTLFYKEICKKDRDMLYRWLLLKTSQQSDEDCRRRDAQMMQKINRVLGTVRKDNEVEIEEEKQKYRDALVGQIYQPIMGEQFCLKDIYVSLQGELIEIGTPYDLSTIKTSIVDTTNYLWDWFAHEDGELLLLHGTPGSGKSSLVKMLAAALAAETDGLIVFVNLYKLQFSDKENAFRVVEQYVKDNAPWFFDESMQGKRLMILDGLDEIRYKPYDNAEELLRGLCENNWNVTCSIILSGRTQIVDFLSGKTNGSELELLPLYFHQVLHDVEAKEQDVEQVHVKEDLRTLYWGKLLDAFDVQLEMPISDERFDELSDSPLLLFMVVWTLAHAGVEFNDLKSTADLYDAIFQHVYTRAYNRISPNDNKNINVREYREYRQMLRYLGATAFIHNSRAISAKGIYDYCKKMGDIELCNEWVRTQREDNPSKLVLLFFLREEQDAMSWEESEIEFTHKTFYEYLAAWAVLDLLFKCESDNGGVVSLLFHLLSYNSLSGKVLDFITEIIEGGNRKIGDKRIVEDTLGKYLENVLYCWCGNCRGKTTDRKISDLILEKYAVPYSELKKKVEIFEGNIEQLLKLITEKEKCHSLDLSDLDFSESYMPYWVFNNANMAYCLMSNGCVSGANFKKCNLKGASIIGAIADQADFSEANLEETDFTSASLAVAVFSNAVCNHAEFMFAQAEGAYFNGCKFVDTSFASACLVAANFDDAVFKNVDFSYADLTRADLSGVTIQGGVWKNCLLQDTKMDGVKLVQFDLDNPDIIEMLCEARLDCADWTGVTKEQRRMLVGKRV